MRQLHRWQYQYLGLTSLPRTLSVLERDAFFTFTSDDIAALQSRYKASLRIGAAIQLGFLRMTGRTLEGVRVVNPKLLTHVAAQLDVPPPSIASLKGIYHHRRRTLYEHQLWALKIAGFTRANDKQLAQLQFDFAELVSKV